jgi:hypothetical protein
MDERPDPAHMPNLGARVVVVLRRFGRGGRNKVVEKLRMLGADPLRVRGPAAATKRFDGSLGTGAGAGPALPAARICRSVRTGSGVTCRCMTDVLNNCVRRRWRINVAGAVALFERAQSDDLTTANAPAGASLPAASREPMFS